MDGFMDGFMDDFDDAMQDMQSDLIDASKGPGFSYRKYIQGVRKRKCSSDYLR